MKSKHTPKKDTKTLTLMTVAFLQASLSITTLASNKGGKEVNKMDVNLFHFKIEGHFHLENSKKITNLNNSYLGGFNLLKSFSYSSSISFEKLMLTSVDIKNFEEEKKTYENKTSQ